MSTGTLAAGRVGVGRCGVGRMSVAAGVLVALAGSGSVAWAQTASSQLRFEVRVAASPSTPAGPWSSTLTVDPGTKVEFRSLVTYTGTAPAFGFAFGGFQPTISRWQPTTDELLAFRTTGGGETGGVAANSGEYGRINPFADPGISSANALRGHTNNVIGGIRFLRIAQNNATNWAGVGSPVGTFQGNNFSGAGGVQVAQRAPFLLPAGAPGFEPGITDVEVTRFAFKPGNDGPRVMEVSAPAESILRAEATNNQRAFGWFNQPNARPTEISHGPVTIVAANVTVIPTPGAMGMLAIAGMMAAGRRRR